MATSELSVNFPDLIYNDVNHQPSDYTTDNIQPVWNFSFSNWYYLTTFLQGSLAATLKILMLFKKKDVVGFWLWKLSACRFPSCRNNCFPTWKNLMHLNSLEQHISFVTRINWHQDILYHILGRVSKTFICYMIPIFPTLLRNYWTKTSKSQVNLK